MKSRVILLDPHLPGKGPEFRIFCRMLARALSTQADMQARHRVLERTRDEIQGLTGRAASQRQVILNFACSVTLDMVAQGWELKVEPKRIKLLAPQTEGVSPEELKQRIREGHLLERDAQLRIPSVREFIQEMERRRLGPQGWCSIFDLMRDGRELVAKLKPIVPEPEGNRRAGLLRRAVAPYLQMVEADVKCKLTGLYLTDIWRYFRHTWVSTYKSLPGRSMMVLVRDSSAPFHPVIGIAALGSSMAQQSLRDQWIGWGADKFLQELEQKPSARMARWVREAVGRLLKAVYVEDLLKEQFVKQKDMRAPTRAIIDRLVKESLRAAAAHRRNPDAVKHKNASNRGDSDWAWKVKTNLFRSKRARTLARLLDIRLALIEAGAKRPTAASLEKALKVTDARDAIRQLVRLVKSEHVGVDMMDIIICGAVPPYNSILGGKLVCTLLCSPEVVKFYRERYGAQESVIASSMKGKAVVRPPNLVLLATTSLYGVGSSQYNRVRIPLSEVGGRLGAKYEYLELGISRGYGSYHFSQATIDYLETMLARTGGGRRVNSIFGEGVNPLMRKLREGLESVGLPPDELLCHGNSRVVYSIPLAENFREVLLGLTSKPRYMLPLQRVTDSTQKLAEFWRKRWLSGRINRPETLEQIGTHTSAYPVTHGARVALPPEGPPELFEESAMR